MKIINYKPSKEIMENRYYKNAEYIIKILNSAGFTAYIAGGFVRDMLISCRKKIKDIDIATSAIPEEIKNLFDRTIEVGIQFGVIIIILDDNQYQIATFRKDDIYIDGRHPVSVSFSGPENDALRRDFTINGLFYDPLNHRIIDFVNGIADIKNKLIKAIGDPYDRFSEDKLRMMRAVRLSSTLLFNIESNTYKAILKESKGLLLVSRERIYEELKKGLTNNNSPSSFILKLFESGLMEYIIPELIPILADNEQRSLICKMLDINPVKNDMAFILSILLHSLFKNSDQDIANIRNISEKIKCILKRLKLKNQDIKDITDIISKSFTIDKSERLDIADLKRLFMNRNIIQYLHFYRIRIIIYGGNINDYYSLISSYVNFLKEKPPRPFLSGKDLHKLGLEKGPLFGKVLEEVFDLQLRDKLKNKDEALEFVIKKYDQNS